MWCFLCFPFVFVGPTAPHILQAIQIDMLTGPVANNLNSLGGFCTGSRHGIVMDHQRINSTSFAFSAVVPALLAVSALEGINILWSTLSI